MGKLGQKIEHIDNATDEIMDKIGDYFWKEHDIDICEYYPNHNNDVSASDKIYSIIHNQLKKTI
mgnify:FL=1|tara:strand:- start:8 stop:199 length:192 start_codon:yes stop_codon:yes gene_type:complete